MNETSTDTRVDELERKVEDLSNRFEKLTEAVADTAVENWQTRMGQLQLQAALGRMEAREEIAPIMDRLRSAFEAARSELTEVPSLVGEAAEDLRPALRRFEKAFDEARRALS